MKNEWPIWGVIGTVVVIILYILIFQPRHQSGAMTPLYPNSSKPSEKVELVTVASDLESPAAAPTPVAMVVSEVVPPTVVTNAEIPAIANVAQPTPAATVVAVEPASPLIESQSPTTNEPIHHLGQYAIQVASVKEKTKVDAELKRISRKLGRETFTTTSDLGVKGVWYRINVGPYTTKDEATADLAKVKTIFKSSFLIKVK